VVFLPFAEFSLEWQAFAWVHAHDVPLWAMDLPLTLSLAGSFADDVEGAGEL